MHPTVRGILAILLNPGGWLFLAAVASPLFLSAARGGGRGRAVLTALALAFGAALGDFRLVARGGSDFVAPDAQSSYGYSERWQPSWPASAYGS